MCLSPYATPQYGGMFFVGTKGETYPVDIYVSDVNGARINWDGGAGAGSTSPTYWKAPVDVILTDYSMVTGTADTEKIRLLRDSKPTGHVLRYVPHLTSNSNRPRLRIGFKKGTEISAVQISD